eukprot:SAG11_NODE_2596_length_3183_cov_12.191310_4_plen_225_part_00
MQSEPQRWHPILIPGQATFEQCLAAKHGRIHGGGAGAHLFYNISDLVTDAPSEHFAHPSDIIQLGTCGVSRENFANKGFRHLHAREHVRWAAHQAAKAKWSNGSNWIPGLCDINEWESAFFSDYAEAVSVTQEGSPEDRIVCQQIAQAILGAEQARKAAAAEEKRAAEAHRDRFSVLTAQPTAQAISVAAVFHAGAGGTDPVGVTIREVAATSFYEQLRGATIR